MRYLFNEIQAFSVIHPINIRPLQTLSENENKETQGKKAVNNKFIVCVFNGEPLFQMNRWVSISFLTIFRFHSGLLNGMQTYFQ